MPWTNMKAFATLSITMNKKERTFAAVTAEGSLDIQLRLLKDNVTSSQVNVLLL